MAIRTVSFLLLFATLAFSPNRADAFLGKLFKKDSEATTTAAAETMQIVSAGSEELNAAVKAENSGNRGKARDLYKRVVKDHPNSEAAARAQFRIAQITEKDGNPTKAFDQYEKVIVNHRNSPDFNEAIARQYAIANALQSSDKKGFLGIGAPVQPSRLIEMYQQIGQAAPYSEYAPLSLIRIGDVQAKQGEKMTAIATLQKVVDTYPKTKYASDAQYKIFRLRGQSAEKSFSPVEDRAQLEAGLDFVNISPDDERSAKVKEDLADIENRSIEKLFAVGQSYEKYGKPSSAKVYYREVVKAVNSPLAAKAQKRLDAINQASGSATAGE